MLDDDSLEAWDPNLKHYRVLKSYDNRYNCVSWAVADKRRWWWPTNHDDHFWPGVPSGNTERTFDRLFIDRGNGIITTDIRKEIGYTKLALYGFNNRGIQHMARQMPNGTWESKLGNDELIEHRLEELEGSNYGNIIKFYKLLDDDWHKLRTLK